MERADEGALRPARDQAKRGGGSRRGRTATSGSEERTDLILRVAQKARRRVGRRAWPRFYVESPAGRTAYRS